MESKVQLKCEICVLRKRIKSGIAMWCQQQLPNERESSGVLCEGCALVELL